ncbi:MAG: hypothetical protein JSU81_05815 [Candidatus Coatesbacteria bacterium]|nr:MAG: hypothetical protein JSU81_05815 [Candidatus Coatesbacteria bacterium]
MKRVVVIIAAFAGAAFFVGEAGATGWRIVASYPAPAPNARGIQMSIPFVQRYGVLCDGSPPRIYELLNPSRYITLNMPSGAWGYAPVAVGRIWVSNRTNHFLYEFTTSGSLVSSFRCPKNGPADLGYDRWVAIPAENVAIRLDTRGSIVSSFAGPGSRLTGLFAYGNGYDYIVGDPDTHKLYFHGYGTGSLRSPIGITSDLTTGHPPWGHVYVVDASTNYVYNFEWFGQEAVAPASLGRVKALFR